MLRPHLFIALLRSACLLTAMVAFVQGQDAAAPAEAPAPVTFTTQEDHRNMIEQLGITKLRPGPSGNPSAPNSANYDEALANPFPEWPGRHLPEPDVDPHQIMLEAEAKFEADVPHA